MNQIEVIDHKIAAVKHLYERITGVEFTPAPRPSAPIPPEADAETFVEENIQKLQRVLAELSGAAATERGSRSLPCPVNVLESEKEWIFEFDVPGTEKRDVHVNAQDGMLRVIAERRPNGDAREVHVESARSPTERTIPLPLDARVETVRAKLERGQLIVRFAKGPAGGAKKEIDIEVPA